MKKPPFVERQERRRQLERLRASQRELSRETQDWSHQAYERLLRDIQEIDAATRMLPSGSIN